MGMSHPRIAVPVDNPAADVYKYNTAVCTSPFPPIWRETTPAPSLRDSIVLQSPAWACHEIKNILAVIAATAELALNKEDPTEMRQALEAILSAVDRATTLARETCREPAPRRPKRVEADLTELLSRTLDSISVLLLRRNVTLVERFEQVPRLKVDPEGMRSVFTNIAINAAEAMEPYGGELTVRVRRAGDSVVVSFSDTGCGMTDSTARRIFDAAFTTKPHQGCGIGLTMCREIVASHGGTINTCSIPEMGTTFTIRLPLPSGQSLPARERPARTTPGKSWPTARRRVLIVDDESSLREIIPQLLGHVGYDVSTAATREQAVELCRQEFYDVVLLDVSMPGMSCEATLKTIRSVSPRTAVLAFSGQILDLDKTNLDADGFVRKPFRLHEMVSMIEGALSRRLARESASADTACRTKKP